MAYRLKEATYKVRCRHRGCSFVSEFLVQENLMGATKADIDSEAWKIAKGLGTNRHDAIHGKHHPMIDPEVRRIRSVYVPIGADALLLSHAAARR